jgi:hypothetical protein
MRSLLAILMIAIVAAIAAADVIHVPNAEEGLNCIQDGINLAAVGDTVLIHGGVYDSVHFVDETPLGRRSAICIAKDGVTIRGIDRDDVMIDHTLADFGVLCLDVGSSSQIKNLTILGGVAKGMDLGDDEGDGRDLRAGIACLESASPTVRHVTIEESSTGIMCRTDCAPTIEESEIVRSSHHAIYIYENGTSPVVIDQVTLVANFDHGVKMFGGSATITSSSITHNHKSGIYAWNSNVTIEYCNLYWNDYNSDPAENYGGDLSDLTGTGGNISEEPFYCDYTGSAGYDYHVCFLSPNIGGGAGGVNIGAWGGGCSDCVSPVEVISWGAIKALYR